MGGYRTFWAFKATTDGSFTLYFHPVNLLYKRRYRTHDCFCYQCGIRDCKNYVYLLSSCCFPETKYKYKDENDVILVSQCWKRTDPDTQHFNVERLLIIKFFCCQLFINKTRTRKDHFSPLSFKSVLNKMLTRDMNETTYHFCSGVVESYKESFCVADRTSSSTWAYLGVLGVRCLNGNWAEVVFIATCTTERNYK